MEVIQVFDRPASRSFYTVAGRFLFVEAVDPRLARLVQQLFAGWQLTPVSPLAHEAEIEIGFFTGEPRTASTSVNARTASTSVDIVPEIPPNLDQFDIAEGGRCYTEANAYYLQFANSLLRLRQEVPVRVDVWFRQVPDSADAELARVTSFAVCAALRRFGLFDLHSAGVVEPESGAGVLIIGASGSGKSTLTFQLATAGWAYLSDDEVLLSLDESQVVARGFRSFFAMREVAGAGFKNIVQPANVFSSEQAPEVAPRWLLFTRITGEKQTRMSELTQAETMTRLIRACPWATYDRAIAEDNLKILSRLARQATAFDLLAGTDLLAPGHAAELLNQHLRQN